MTSATPNILADAVAQPLLGNQPLSPNVNPGVEFRPTFLFGSPPLHSNNNRARQEENTINSKSLQDKLFGLFTAAELQPASSFHLYPDIYQDVLSESLAAEPQGSGCVWEDATGIPTLGWPYFSNFTEPEENIVGNKNPQNESASTREQGSSSYAYNALASLPIAEHQENAEAEPSLERAHPQPHHSLPPAIHRDAGNKCENKCRGIFAGPHKCSYQGRALTITCQKCSREFARRNEFNRHWKHIHGDRKLFDCPIAGCNRVGKKGFTRNDNLTQHRRLFHREDIVKNPIRYGHSNNTRGPALERIR